MHDQYGQRIASELQMIKQLMNRQVVASEKIAAALEAIAAKR